MTVPPADTQQETLDAKRKDHDETMDQYKRIVAALAAPSDVMVTLKRRLDYRMNEHLCEMKPDFDDSITGFNEAWKIVDNLFAEATIAALAQTAPVTAQPAPPTSTAIRPGAQRHSF